MPTPTPRTSHGPPPSFEPTSRVRHGRFGRYEIIGQLASGGMGVVYLARLAGALGFRRLYALKLMHEHLAREPAFVDMLLDEARLASRLHHANVVPIVDLGTEGGRLYVVMDYVEGCSLDELCRRTRRRRPARMIVPLLVDTLEGLEAAHSLTNDDGEPLGLVHRDVSAQNVMVGVDGVARVIDFGVAKAKSRIGSTRPGVMRGKLACMAPEQLTDGAAVDRRADLFAAGAMMWSALTGAPLFEGDSDSRTMANVLGQEVVPPSTVGFHPPACFDEICLRALARDPEDRYHTAAEMARALRQTARDSRCQAHPGEIAAWVRGIFANELAARRHAVRAVAGLGDAPASGILPALGDSGVDLVASVPDAEPGGDSEPREYVTAAWPIVGALVVAVAAVAWQGTRPAASSATTTMSSVPAAASAIHPPPSPTCEPAASAGGTASAPPLPSTPRASRRDASQPPRPDKTPAPPTSPNSATHSAGAPPLERNPYTELGRLEARGLAPPR